MKTSSLKNLKVALVHDWLNGMRGGEKCLEYFCELFPNAEIFTLHSEPQKISDTIKNHKIYNSFIQKLPLKTNFYRHYLPLFPLAVKQFDFSKFDLIISLSHCAVKNINIPTGIPHICYCFSPMRYIWFLKRDYFGKNNLKSFLLHPIFQVLKNWDLKGSETVSKFIAISKTVQGRIKDIYNRESEIIYPPVDIPFSPNINKSNYYLVLSALTPYKRIDLVVKAFNLLNIPLIIAGEGTENLKLKKLANSNIKFLGWVSDSEKKELLKNAKALIFPGLEDFGIVPLEAMSFATPVICFGSGGVTETVENNKTGIYFDEQTIDSLISVIKNFDKFNIDTANFKNTTDKFSILEFKNKILTFIQENI